MLPTQETPTKEKKVKIAYLILVHRLPAQFKRLFEAIYTKDNYYLIHIDKRSERMLHTEILDFLTGYENVSFLESQSVYWGGYSIVDVELRGIEKLLALNTSWDFFINLSGQDFPLFSQEYISKYLENYRGKSFMQVAKQRLTRPETLNRIENYFLETSEGFVGKPSKREYMNGIIPYIGGQWMILARIGAEFIIESPEVEKFKDYYKNTLIPDESFFQTVLKNTSFKGKIIPNDKRAIIWIPEFGPELSSQVFTENETLALIQSGKVKLRPKTLSISDRDFLKNGNNLFGRKFDETYDNEILDVLEKIITEE